MILKNEIIINSDIIKKGNKIYINVGNHLIEVIGEIESLPIKGRLKIGSESKIFL